MREGIRPLRSASRTWRSIGWAFVVIGMLVIILGIFMCPFASVQTIGAAYTFYNTAQTTEGIVQASHQEDFMSCRGEGACTKATNCTTKVRYTPPGRRTSFTTIDDQCDALRRGTRVRVLYNPRYPSV